MADGVTVDSLNAKNGGPENPADLVDAKNAAAADQDSNTAPPVVDEEPKRPEKEPTGLAKDAKDLLKGVTELYNDDTNVPLQKAKEGLGKALHWLLRYEALKVERKAESLKK